MSTDPNNNSTAGAQPGGGSSAFPPSADESNELVQQLQARLATDHAFRDLLMQALARAPARNTAGDLRVVPGTEETVRVANTSGTGVGTNPVPASSTGGVSSRDDFPAPVPLDGDLPSTPINTRVPQAGPLAPGSCAAQPLWLLHWGRPTPSAPSCAFRKNGSNGSRRRRYKPRLRLAMTCIWCTSVTLED